MINQYNFYYIEKATRKKLKNLEKSIFFSNRKEYKCISMFPYPSGLLHLGHFRNYIINDLICRKKLIKGYKSFMFFGWDSFGLPAEKKSIEKKMNPKEWVKKNIIMMKNQLNKMCLIINWNNEIVTSKVSYYKYNQLLFKYLFKHKFIFKRKNWVNWDNVDKTVLSEEQVIKGKGWRSNSLIKKKLLPMYYFSVKKIIKSILNYPVNNWPKKVINLQNKWIGKKKCFKFFFYFNKKKFSFYTYKIKNLFFYNSIHISYENYSFIKNILKYKYIFKKIYNFVNSKKKLYYTGLNAYFYFYKKIKYKIIISKSCYNRYIILKKCKKYNTNNFLLKIFLKIFLKENCFKKFKKYLNNKKKAKKTYIFRLKDWSLSRQRYWGTPIPLLKCKRCGFFIKKIPFKNPFSDKKYINYFNLKKKNYIFQKCSKCKGNLKKEIETLDTFFDSSWYFLKFFVKNPFKKKINIKPINTYIGGIEHAILHLLYIKYIFIFMKKINMCNLINPLKKIITQGLVLNYSYFSKKKNYYIKGNKNIKEKDIVVKLEKMSKSKKNGLNPNDLIKKYGIDCLRMYIFFSCSLKDELIFDEKKIIGIKRFITNIWKFFIKINFKNFNKKENNSLDKKEKNFFKLIVNNLITSYENLKINKVISHLMVFFKKIKYTLKIKKKIDNFFFEIIVRFLSFIHPISPLFSYFLWNSTGINKIKNEIYNVNTFKKYNIKKNIFIKFYINGKFLFNKKIKKIKIHKFIKNKIINKNFKFIINNNVCNILHEKI
ncbi:class I tRNA ligase family protein [Candidatus Vidania fulgoroideorum]